MTVNTCVLQLVQNFPLIFRGINGTQLFKNNLDLRLDTSSDTKINTKTTDTHTQRKREGGKEKKRRKRKDKALHITLFMPQIFCHFIFWTYRKDQENQLYTYFNMASG